MLAIVIIFCLGLIFPWVLFVGLALWFLMGLYRLITEQLLPSGRGSFR